MNRGEYVSFFLKRLPTLVREWVTSSYLLLSNKAASWIAMLTSWAMNTAQNCKSEILDSPYLLPQDCGIRARLTYSPLFVSYSIIVRSI
jgi:hypothetical protein